MRCVRLMVVVCVLASAQAGAASDLSRREAAAQIEARLRAEPQWVRVSLGDENRIVLTYRLTPHYYPVLKERGLLVATEVQTGQYRVGISDVGKKYVLAEGLEGNGQVAQVKLADLATIEVKGITVPASDISGMRVSYANFEARFRPTPFGEAIPDYTSVATRGQARFVLFNDGWKLERLNSDTVSRPPPGVAKPTRP